MPDIGPHTKLDRLIGAHLTVGTLIGLAVLVRVSWRLHGAPGCHRNRASLAAPRCASDPRYALRPAAIVPLLGLGCRIGARLARVSFSSTGSAWIGPRGSKSGFLAGDVHAFLAYTLLAIVTLHIAAALYHRLILHDRVLARMLPGRASRAEPPWR